MASFNQHIILGRLGQDPVLRYTGAGTAVADLSVATSYRYKKGEEYVEKTTWHKVTVWGQAAEFVANRARKGSEVLIQGSVENDSWEDGEGNTRYKTYTKADSVEIVSGWVSQDEEEEIDY